VIKEIIFEINGKEIRLTESEAMELKKDLDKRFPVPTYPAYPVYPQKWDEPFPKVVWGDDTAPVRSQKIVCGNNPFSFAEDAKQYAANN